MGKERRQHRQVKRVIRGAIKSLKRGEVPYPPEPTHMSAEDSRQFTEELKAHAARGDETTRIRWVATRTQATTAGRYRITAA